MSRAVSVVLCGLVFLIAGCPCGYHGRYEAENRKTFSDTYSRPNDDTFQNAAGNAGVPYEVAKVKLDYETVNHGNRTQLIFKWSAEMVTGQHVEAGEYFVIESIENNLQNRPSKTLAPISVSYPKGVHRQSPPDQKRGSLLSTSLDLGESTGPGEYAGKMVLKVKSSVGEGSTTKHFQDGGPKTGIFKTILWKFTVKEGRVTNFSSEYKRAKDPQVRLISSNYYVAGRAIYQPYPKQPPAALCMTEKVGDGGQESEGPSALAQLEKELAPKIREAGCLSCHGQGVGDNQLFCDDGRSLRPSTTFPSILGFMDDRFNWEQTDPTGKRRYRKSMQTSMDELRRGLTHQELSEMERLFASR